MTLAKCSAIQLETFPLPSMPTRLRRDGMPPPAVLRRLLSRCRREAGIVRQRVERDPQGLVALPGVGDGAGPRPVLRAFDQSLPDRVHVDVVDLGVELGRLGEVPIVAAAPLPEADG